MKARIKLFLLNLIRFLSGKKIIVSLTSYPARYGSLHLVIESMLKQRLKADLVVLYLYEGEAESLPESLLQLQSKYFRIEKVKENIRPHKKYYYAFRDYPHDLIITVDDDVIYPNDLIYTLYRKHLQYKDAIVCCRSRRASYAENGQLLPYNSWRLCISEGEPEMGLLATGIGGVLYSPKLLDKRVLDMDKLKELALNQDDLWLKTMEILKGTKTVVAAVDWKKARELRYENALFATNEFGDNDLCLGRLMDYYGLSENHLKD